MTIVRASVGRLLPHRAVVLVVACALGACSARETPPLAAGTMGPVVSIASTADPIGALHVSTSGEVVTVQWDTARDREHHVMAVSVDRGRHFGWSSRVGGPIVDPRAAPASWVVARTADPALFRATPAGGSRDNALTMASPLRDGQLVSASVDADDLLLTLWSSSNGRQLSLLRQSHDPRIVHAGAAFEVPLIVASDAQSATPGAAAPLSGGAVVVWPRAAGDRVEIVAREVAFDALCAPVAPAPSTVSASRTLPLLPPVVVH